MKYRVVLLAVLAQIVLANVSLAQIELLQQEASAVETTTQQSDSSSGINRYSFLQTKKKLHPAAGTGVPFDPAQDAIAIANTTVKIPASCLPGIGEGDVCEGDYVSPSGACYGMVVVAANYYRRVVRRIGQGREAVSRWNATAKVQQVRNSQSQSSMIGLPQHQHEDASDSDGVNKVCEAVLANHPEAKAAFKGNKKLLPGIRLERVCFHTPIKQAIQGAALWHQIDQNVPGRSNLQIPAGGEELHRKMESLKGRLDRHGLATILWKNNDARNPIGHAFLLHAINEIEVQRGGGTSEIAWELCLYDPNLKYHENRRSKNCVYYLPERRRMTFSKEFISFYCKRGVKVQDSDEFIDGNRDVLFETTPEMWNTTFLAKTIVYKQDRRYMRQLATAAD